MQPSVFGKRSQLRAMSGCHISFLLVFQREKVGILRLFSIWLSSSVLSASQALRKCRGIMPAPRVAVYLAAGPLNLGGKLSFTHTCNAAGK